MASRSPRAPAIAITRPDKVFFPATGFTKADLISYYERVSPVMLPHLARRPVTLVRYPDGVDGISFYEKRCPADHPPFLKQAEVSSTHHGSMQFCTIDNTPSLLWLANRAAIEFHPYLYRSPHQDAPTMMVFDLDPGMPATMYSCIPIALTLRDLLREMDLQAFVKTSGGKGLHVMVPLRGATFAQTKACARDVAEALTQHSPRRVTATMAKAQRSGKVLIDWSQNDHGKTTACAYTLRAKSAPTVSMPVSWTELEQSLARGARGKQRALSFSPAEALARVAALGDLAAPVLSLQQRLPTRWAPRVSRVATSTAR